MKIEYKPDPNEDDLAPGETEHADVEVHRVIEEKAGGQLTTVREDIDSDQKYSWPPVTGDHPRVTILEDSDEST